VKEELQRAALGAGLLLQRDYFAVLEPCPMSSSELMDHVKTHFRELAPDSFVTFSAPEGIGPGAHLDVRIAGAGDYRVRVVHSNAQSLTLATLGGHPEAGRITFGAYRHQSGGVVFHIRSRARSSSLTRLLGFLTVGEAMQTNTWTDFINNTATSAGARIVGTIKADTMEVPDTSDDETCDGPTFLAEGD
jgi:hypothetical protein